MAACPCASDSRLLSKLPVRKRDTFVLSLYLSSVVFQADGATAADSTFGVMVRSPVEKVSDVAMVVLRLAEEGQQVVPVRDETAFVRSAASYHVSLQCQL